MSEIQLTSDLIQWKDGAADWEEAIRESAAPLLQQGNIAESYIDAMVENIRTLGPYILIAPNVALPHARPEMGVSEAGIALTVFNEDVAFPAGHDNKTQTARIFICLAAVDSDSHLSLLQGISQWIDNSELLNRLLEASSKDEVEDLINQYS
ncbi:PTS sugar transporter subunit IIA [Salisediminibacterium halotolerans]|uniref:Ascorbate-specific PTS system EIIA component n=1 Tax=Salisediminibacterium halotolerans TaxID=517425 RepID=A0A1H9W939_9BACI|nr:PTS sugar transporter subunit IIA [Salisediminibacterium haloalkalitolerans]SES30476.1 PTS system, ascorbate-specific IIA component [Salisediminibacterium haloalkalitolerans]